MNQSQEGVHKMHGLQLIRLHSTNQVSCGLIATANWKWYLGLTMIQGISGEGMRVLEAYIPILTHQS
jgi:hypothetical protein